MKCIYTLLLSFVHLSMYPVTCLTVCYSFDSTVFGFQ